MGIWSDSSIKFAVTVVGTIIQMLQFKYALRRLLIRKSIEPSKTGNFTSLDDSLCDSEKVSQFEAKDIWQEVHRNNCTQKLAIKEA